MHRHFNLKLWFLIGLIVWVKNETINITFKDGKLDSDQFLTTNTQTYQIEFGEIKDNYLMLNTKQNDKSNPAYMYLSASHDSPSRQNFDLLSYESDNNLIFVPVAWLADKTSFYVTVQCPKDCAFTFKSEFLPAIVLEKGQSYSYWTLESKEENYVYIYRENTGQNDMVTFYAIGGELNDLSMSLAFYNPIEQGIEFDHFIIQNGQLATINEIDYDYIDGSYYKMTIKSEKNIVVRVGSRSINDVNTIKLDQPAHYGLMSTKTFTKGFECFSMDDDEAKADTDYLLTVFTTSYNLELCLSSTSNKISEDAEKRSIHFQEAIILTSEMRKKYKNICVRPYQFNVLSYIIQLTSFPENKTEPNIEPLTNGFIYKYILKNNNYQYYRHYMHLSSNEISYNMQIIKGHPVMYAIECDDFPNCNYDDSTIESLIAANKIIKPHWINDMYTVSIYNEEENLFSKKQMLLVVKCGVSGDGNCEYRISYFDYDDHLTLLENSMYTQYLNKGKNDVYNFYVINPNVERVVVTWDTFTGNSHIENTSGSNRNMNKFWAGNKEIIEFTKKESTGTQESNPWLGFYSFKIVGNTSNFYGVSFREVVSIPEYVNIGSGIALIETVSAERKEKVFRIQHDYINEKAAFVTIINSLNCDIEVKFKNEVLSSVGGLFQHELVYGDDDYNMPSYDYNIAYKDAQGGASDALCMIQVGSQEMHEDAHIVLDEGNPFRIKLDTKIPKVKFLYPHPHISGDIVVRINLETEALLDVSILIEGSNLGNSFSFTRSRNIVIPESFVDEDHCPDMNVCNILVEVTSKDPIKQNEDITFDISIKSTQVIATYLQKSKYREDFFYADSARYFFTDVAKDEKGEILVNFLRGNGKILARLVSKDISEPHADWKNSFTWPTKNSTDLLEYDPYLHKVLYDSKDTENCINGCFLVFAIVTDDAYSDGVSEYFMTEFSLYVRSLQSVVQIPVNEYVAGNVLDTIKNKYYDSYVFIIPNETDEIIFEIQSENCNIYVNYGTENPTVDNADWAFESHGKNSIHVIKKQGSLILDSTLKGKTLSISIGSDTWDSIYTSWYVFNIRTPSQNEPKLHEVDSDQSMICDIDSENGYCDFILWMNDYVNLNNLFVHAYSNDYAKLILYAKFVPINEYDVLSKAEKEKKLPRVGNNDFTTEKEFNTNYLEIDFNNWWEGNYLLLSVQSNIKTQITLLTTYRSYWLGTSPSPTTVQIFNLSLDAYIDLEIPANKNYILHVTSIDGQGTVSFKNEEEYVLKGSKDSFSWAIKTTEPRRIIKLSAAATQLFRCYVWFTIRPETNFDEIPFNSSGDIFYVDDFPIALYTKVDDETDDVSFNVNFISLDKASGTSPDSFEILCVVTNELVIFEMKQGKKDSIPLDMALHGVFDISLREGKITISNRLIKEYITKIHKYWYIQIKKSGNNTNVYSKVHMEYSVLLMSNHRYVTPVDSYRSGSLLPKQNKPNFYQLRRNHEDDNWLRLEFASNSDAVTFALIEYSDDIPVENYYKNSTALTIQSSDNKYGKSTVIVKMTKPISNDETVQPIEKIILSIFPNNTEHTVASEEPNHFTFKYSTSNNFVSYEFENGNNTPSFNYDNSDKNDLKVTVTINQLRLPNDQINTVPATYLLRVVESAQIPTNGHLDSIAITGLNPYLLLSQKNDKSKKQLTFTINKFPNDKKYVVSVIVITDNDNEMFAYSSIVNPTGFDDKETSFKIPLWVLIVLIVLFILIILGLVFWFIHAKNSNDSLRTQVQQVSFIQGDKHGDNNEQLLLGKNA